MISALRDRWWSAAPGLASLLAAVAIIAIASFGLWSVLQPPSKAIGILQLAEPTRLAMQLQSRHVYGSGGADHDGQVGHQSENLRLVGAVTGEEIALIAVDGHPARTFHTGEQVVPGARLISVMARRVELERRGEKEVLQMPEAGSPAALRSK
jgi:hypothetical protein